MPHLGGVSVGLTPNSANHAWQQLRLSLSWAQTILCNHHPVFRRCRSSNAAIAKHERGLPFENEPNVYPESLRQTLDAHREANRASLIHKVPEAGKKQSLALGPSVAESPQTFPEKKFQTAIHLKLARTKRHAGRRARGRLKDDEYIGKSPGLTAQWENERRASFHKRLPWLREISAASELQSAGQCSASERLNSEILAFHDYILPTVDERAAADQAITALRACMTSIDTSAQVDLIGSRRTGLATALSDLDFNIIHPNGGSSTGLSRDRELAHELLRSLWTKLPKRRNSIQASSFIAGARVPIITGFHAPTNLKFQIQCTGDVRDSIRYVQDSVAEYPTLRPLYMVLRQMLEIRGLNIGRMGGVGSYPLLIMIIAALKFGEGRIGRREAGKQLCFFLDMYSNVDFYTTAISLNPLEYVLKGVPKRTGLSVKGTSPSPDDDTHFPALEKLPEHDLEGRKWFAKVRAEPHLMCLRDPSNPAHDLGKQVKLIKHVQAFLIEAKLKLRESMDAWDSTDWTQSTSKRTKAALLDWCLGADYEIYEDERRLLSLAGQSRGQTEPSQAIGANGNVFTKV